MGPGLATTTALAGAALALAGAAQAAPSVEVKDAVIRVTVVPEARSDIKVEVIQANAKLPIQVRTLMGRTIVDGGLGRRIRGCQGHGEAVTVRVKGMGLFTWADMPRVVIRTPRDVNIDTGGAVWGVMGRSANLKLGSAGCGAWTIGNVEDSMVISQADLVDTRAGSARTAKFRVAGSGDVHAAEVHGPVEVDLAGSGDVSVAAVNGPLKIRVAGSGDVTVAGGRATTMNVAVMGSGNVNFNGVADRLKASVAGSGEVHAREVRGPVNKSVMGSGGVTVGR